jgi:hypothetical protein
MNKADNLLFYSNKCLHSKELLNLLYKYTELNQKITKINIDNPNIKLPPYVKSVPTAIIQIEGKPNLMVGSQIFKWYNQTHSKKVEQQGILDWDPHTMAGYSDGFSYLENTNDVMKKSFSFINDNNAIITPDEKNYSGDSNGSKKNEPKTQLDSDFENFMNQRQYEVPQNIPKI